MTSDLGTDLQIAILTACRDGRRPTRITLTHDDRAELIRDAEPGIACVAGPNEPETYFGVELTIEDRGSVRLHLFPTRDRFGAAQPSVVTVRP